MEIALLVLFFTLIPKSYGTHCDKQLNYHDNYGYGIDIICEGLSDENSNILVEISVSNELVLKIINSNLTKVTSHLFENVQKIRYLSLINSTFHFGQNESVFADLVKLEHISIKKTQFNHLNTHIFQGLEHLKELDLLQTGLKLIKNGTFSVFENLKTLKLSKNNFGSLFDIPLCELPSLKHLDLDHNKIEEIGSFLVCFEKEDESAFSLNGKNYEVKYKNQELYHQTMSKLQLIELNLSHNYIKNIQPLDWTPNLKYLDLSENRLYNVSEKLFSALSKLEELSLENNFLKKVDTKAFVSLQNLKVINLENNTLSDIWLENLTNLEDVNLSKNKLTSESLKHLKDLPKIKKLLLNDNSIKNLSGKVLRFPSLRSLDLSNNNILKLDYNSLQNLTNLRELFIKNNSLEEIPYSLFSNLSNLEILDISMNKLSTMKDPRTFMGLDNLQSLNISHNRIEDLSYELLKPLRNLQVLDIAGNRLHKFQINLISLLPSLRVINIKSNLLSCSILEDIIKFLRLKNVSYTINEDFEFEKQNIGGIYCEEMSEMEINSTRSEIIGSESNGIRLSSGLGIMFILVISCIVISFAFYKCLLYARRRRYTMDQIELL